VYRDLYVGGGISGLTTAYLLAKAGARHTHAIVVLCDHRTAARTLLHMHAIVDSKATAGVCAAIMWRVAPAASPQPTCWRRQVRGHTLDALELLSVYGSAVINTS
jgi:glycine/D-amino acid oxidase-like deaminating enzyme